MRKALIITVIALAATTAAFRITAQNPENPLFHQTQAEADAKSNGCLKCHAGIEPMHPSPAVKLGCTDCHGGDNNATTKEAAHIKPLHPEIWTSSANPPRTYTALLE